MKNWKRPTAAILLTGLLMQLNITAESMRLKTNSETGYGIDLTKSYSGADVQRFIDSIMEESDAAIKKAFGEGYKAALLEVSPENTRLTILNDSLRRELDIEQKKLKVPWWIIPVAAATGTALGLIIGIMK